MAELLLKPVLLLFGVILTGQGLIHVYKSQSGYGAKINKGLEVAPLQVVKATSKAQGIDLLIYAVSSLSFGLLIIFITVSGVIFG